MHAPRHSASIVLAAASAIALLFACNQSGPSQLEVRLVDAPNPLVDQIVVNVSTVTAHSTTGGWVTIGPVVSPTAVNLLDLQSSFMSLGLVNLPAGKITQIRMIIEPTGNYVVPTGSTAQQPLVVPSGLETGIKILGPWDVPACTRLSVTLDFDGKNSIEYHQADGTWILRPVIRPKHAETTAISCEQPTQPPPQCSTEVPCPAGQMCDSGTCTPVMSVPIGSACTDGSQCVTLTCNDGLCAPGGGGAPCQTFNDCASRQCIEGSCAAPPSSLGAGATCTQNSDCLSGLCEGTCQPGMQGANCNVAGDCLSGICTGGFCAPSP